MIAGGLFLGATLRPSWSWAPQWLTDTAPYAIAIGMMVLGLFVLAEVWHWAQRLWRTIAGTALLLAGLMMLVLPGPGLLTIAAGLFVLSREYDWANRQYERVHRKAHQVKDRAQQTIAAHRDARQARGNVVHPLTSADDARDEPTHHDHRECA